MSDLRSIRTRAEDAEAQLAALRQRAEAAEKHNVGLHIILRTTQRDMERAILRAADAEAAAASANARVAELEAALRSIAGQSADHCPGDSMEDAYGHLRDLAAAALAKGAG